MKFKKRILILFAILITGYSIIWITKNFNLNHKYEIGQQIDELYGVAIYNGGVDHVSDRNVSPDGYNIGLKYQCVEFVKRYYLEHYQHQMPDSYGHAKDFFDRSLKDGAMNIKRDLQQFLQSSASKPEVGDILIFDGSLFNKYGHVAIISSVSNDEVEIIQQNPGPFGSSREKYQLELKEKLWHIDHGRVLGWLRKSTH
ncbi:MAG: CHAP domain-containing protein [Flavobacteriales bacterium]|nr:CHAP domain-containing protein [Flavobacteriales bacterium]